MFLWIFWRAPWQSFDKLDDPWAVWDNNNYFYYGWYFIWIGNFVFWVLPALIWPFTFVQRFENVTHWFIWYLKKVINIASAAMVLLTCVLLIVGGVKYEDNILFSKKEIWITFAIFLANAILNEINLRLGMGKLKEWKIEN